MNEMKNAKAKFYFPHKQLLAERKVCGFYGGYALLAVQDIAKQVEG